MLRSFFYNFVCGNDIYPSAAMYIGLGLMLCSIMPVSTLAFANYGCGGEVNCKGSQICENGTCVYASCNSVSDCASNEKCCNGKCVPIDAKCCEQGHICAGNEECCDNGCKKEGQICCGNGEPSYCCSCGAVSIPITCPEVSM